MPVPPIRYDQNSLLHPATAERTPRRQHSRPAFLKNVLGRRRTPALQIQVPDLSDPRITDAPRTASFLNLKEPRRLRRQNSENMLSTRKAASVGDLELESFLIF